MYSWDLFVFNRDSIEILRIDRIENFEDKNNRNLNQSTGQ